MDKKFISQLTRLFRARFPYIYLTTFEEERAISLIKNISGSEKLVRIPREVYVWTQTEGFTLDGKVIEGTNIPDKAIDFIKNVGITHIRYPPKISDKAPPIAPAKAPLLYPIIITAKNMKASPK